MLHGQRYQGLYYAWESAVRHADGLAQVNLLVNRASPWLDVDSYLPHEGRVVIHVKRARELALRVPRWVGRGELRVSIGGRRASTARIGNYLVCRDLHAGSEVEVEFPVREQTVCFSEGETTWRCRFRGNDLVDVSPRGAEPVYPMYVDRGGGGAGARLRPVSRYVTETILPW